MTPLPPDQCDHLNTPVPMRPIPDWTGTCPDCGERVKHGGSGTFITVAENNARASARTHGGIRIGPLTGFRNSTGKPIEGEVWLDSRGDTILYIKGAGTFHIDRDGGR